MSDIRPSLAVLDIEDRCAADTIFHANRPTGTRINANGGCFRRRQFRASMTLATGAKMTIDASWVRIAAQNFLRIGL